MPRILSSTYDYSTKPTGSVFEIENHPIWETNENAHDLSSTYNYSTQPTVSIFEIENHPIWETNKNAQDFVQYEQ